MKKMVLTGVLLSSVITLLVSCNPKKTEPAATGVDTAQIKNEIQAKENEFAATYNAREVKNIGYYAEDAISFSQNKPPLVGRNAIVNYLIANMSSSQSNKISFKTNEVFVSDDGNQVVEIGYYQVADSVNTTLNSGNYISLFVKKDGKYVCLRDMSTSDMPLE